MEQTLAQIGEAKVFSKLDANSGFWQIDLAPESASLTTFITPFGRYQFNRLPFGITSAPEHFQKRMNQILEGLEGVVCLIDDTLIYGKTKEEHDERLMAVLKRIQEAELTLNKEKCQFCQKSIRFLGQLLDQTSVKPDPEKVRAIKQMKPPTNITELRRFLGMINQLNKFSPCLAERTKHLRTLLSTKNQWVWEKTHQETFDALKEALSSSETLALYSASKETTLSADASSYGLGAVLRQEQENGQLKPIVYISWSMTETEQRYAQIEKEALAATWACERLQDYLLGIHFCIETDHKPLVPLLSSKRLDEVPIRVQRFRLRLMRFSYSIVHVPGKDLCIADALSCAPVGNLEAMEDLQKVTDAFVNLTIETNKRFCQSHWPNKSTLKGDIKKYVPVMNELSVCNNLLIRGDRVVIPPTLQRDILEKLHSGHQGTTKRRERAKHSVWWPGITKDIENIVSDCPMCCKHRQQHAEPLLPSTLPARPWLNIATDLFEWKKHNYLLTVNYYSRYIEIAKLTSTTSADVITHLKSIFARHSIPETVMSDNGPQYAASTFATSPEPCSDRFNRCLLA